MILQIYLFRTHLPGQKHIMLLAETPNQAYEKLIKQLHIQYPNQDIFLQIKRKINLFPMTYDDYIRHEDVEIYPDVPRRVINVPIM